jgi:hypothetical protein
MVWTPVPAPDAVSAAPWSIRSDYLRRDLVARLRRGDLRFHLAAQFFVDEGRTPIEDASVRWSTSVAPLLTLATLTIPRQDLASPEARASETFVDRLSFTPWHCSEAHRPLGNIQRARRAVYEASARHRGATMAGLARN